MPITLKSGAFGGVIFCSIKPRGGGVVALIEPSKNAFIKKGYWNEPLCFMCGGGVGAIKLNNRPMSVFVGRDYSLICL